MRNAATPDLYAVLGVGHRATGAEITRAYRRLLRIHHPDLGSDATSPDSTAELQRVLRAYAVLRDPARRAAYDRGRTRPGRVSHLQTGAPPLWAGPVRWHSVR